MNEDKYRYTDVPSSVYLNILLGDLVQGRATEAQMSEIKYYDMLVTEGCDTGLIVRHRDLHNFNTWIADVQTVMLKSANDKAHLEWQEQYNAECTAAREAREN